MIVFQVNQQTGAAVTVPAVIPQGSSQTDFMVLGGYDNSLCVLRIEPASGEYIPDIICKIARGKDGWYHYGKLPDTALGSAGTARYQLLFTAQQQPGAEPGDPIGGETTLTNSGSYKVSRSVSYNMPESAADLSQYSLEQIYQLLAEIQAQYIGSGEAIKLITPRSGRITIEKGNWTFDDPVITFPEDFHIAPGQQILVFSVNKETHDFFKHREVTINADSTARTLTFSRPGIDPNGIELLFGFFVYTGSDQSETTVQYVSAFPDPIQGQDTGLLTIHPDEWNGTNTIVAINNLVEGDQLTFTVLDKRGVKFIADADVVASISGTPGFVNFEKSASVPAVDLNLSYTIIHSRTGSDAPTTVSIVSPFPAPGAKFTGTVESVNNVFPDSAGNVKITPKDVGARPVGVPIKASDPQDFTNDLHFIDKTVQDLDNYYDKRDVDNKISAIPKFGIKVVDQLPELRDADLATVYLLKEAEGHHPEPGDIYTEYICVEDTAGRHWEKLGDQSINLEEFVKYTEILEEFGNDHKKVLSQAFLTHQHEQDLNRDNAMSDRINFVENSTLKPVENNETAYQKPIPAGSGPLADINKIGGRTYSSYNLLKDYILEPGTSIDNHGIHFEILPDWTIIVKGENTDGEIPTVYLASGMDNLPDTVNVQVIGGQPGVHITCGNGDYPYNTVQSGKNMDFTRKPDATGRKMQFFMLRTDKLAKVDTTIKVQMTAGAGAKDYVEPFKGLRDTKVTNVDSYGADEALVGSLTIPAAVQDMPGYGQSNPANSTQRNYLDLETKRYVKQGQIIGDAWVTSPKSETDVSQYFPDGGRLQVQAGGRVVFENAHKDPIPSDIKTYERIKIQWENPVLKVVITPEGDRYRADHNSNEINNAANIGVVMAEFTDPATNELRTYYYAKQTADRKAVFSKDGYIEDGVPKQTLIYVDWQGVVTVETREAKGGGDASIDDATVSKTTTWSSDKINSELETVNERVDFLESANSNIKFTEDKSVAYRKDVPAYASPVAVVSEIGGRTYKSENLITNVVLESSNVAGVNFSMQEDGTIVMNGTATDNNYNYIMSGPNQIQLASGEYTLSANNAKNSGTPAAILQIINDSNDQFISIQDNTNNAVATDTIAEGRYSVRIRVQSGVTYNDYTLKPMLNQGGKAKPYSLGFPGLRDTPVTEVRSEGANLFDGIVDKEDGYYYGNGDWGVDPRYNCYYISVKPGGTYSINVDFITAIGFDKNGNFVAGVGFDHTFAVRETVTELRIGIDKEIAKINKIQFNEGSLVSEYTPYGTTISTIPIPKEVQELEGYGMSAGQYSNKTDLVSKTQGHRAVSAVLDGTTNKITGMTSYQGLYVGIHYFENKDHGIPGTDGLTISYFYEKYDYVKGAAFVNQQGDGIFICHYDQTLTTADAWNDWLKQHPIDIRWAVADYSGDTDISQYFPNGGQLKVQGGGSVVFENEHRADVPSTLNTVSLIKPRLQTPENVQISGTTVSYDAVPNATAYGINVGGTDWGTLATLTRDLATLPGWSKLAPGTHRVEIRAVADGFLDSTSVAVEVVKDTPTAEPTEPASGPEPIV